MTNEVNIYEARTTTDEQIVRVYVNDLQDMPRISNLDWLIKVALDPHPPVMVGARY